MKKWIQKFINRRADLQRPTPWQLVFLLSKANGADYHGDRLPVYRWIFPQRTWLQNRLRDDL